MSPKSNSIIWNRMNRWMSSKSLAMTLSFQKFLSFTGGVLSLSLVVIVISPTSASHWNCKKLAWVKLSLAQLSPSLILSLHPNLILNNIFFFQPENVVCTQKENTSVKIIDFGTAKELEPTEKVIEAIKIIFSKFSNLKLHKTQTHIFFKGLRYVQ